MVKYLSAMLNLGVTQQYYKNYEECCASPTKCHVTLKNAELWKQFHSLGTEMIITKSGRRMFPSLHVQVSDLSPNALYCVILEMVPATHNRFKYSSSGGWFPAGTEEAQSPHRIYLHPDSPARGDYWMSQPISFGRLKLTNTIAPPAGQVVLSSMHKYQPRIIIAKASDPREIAWAPSTSVAFPETQFIAVTAYQNEKITKLKIDNNPFAKGFRESGQAKCKRKRTDTEDTGENKMKERKLDPLLPLKVEEDRLSPYSQSSISPVSSTESCPKPNSSYYSNQSKVDSRLSCSSLSPLSSPELCKKIKPSLYPYQNFNPYEQNKQMCYPYFYPFPAYTSPVWSQNSSPFYARFPCSSMLHQSSLNLSTKEKMKDKPRKVTDFSIRAITGYN